MLAASAPRWSKADRRDLHEELRRFASLGERANLGVILRGVPLEGVELLPQLG